MSAEYKVTKGIYMRKYQAKNNWEVGGGCVEKQRIQRNFAMWISHCEMAKFRTMKKISLRNFRNLAKFSQPCEIGHLAWCSCLPKAISSSFQLQIIHGLKRWILEFLSFEMVYSMSKMNFGKYSKSAKEDCSCCRLIFSLCFSLLGLS